jgi:hypothetical protein
MVATNEYVDVREGGYHIAGTRIGPDVLGNDFRRRRSAEAIFEAYASTGSLAKVYGAITFVLEHPAQVEAYLNDQDCIFEQIKAQYRMRQRQDMIDLLSGPRKKRRQARLKICFQADADIDPDIRKGLPR